MATSAQVAARAGVSRSTVSQIFNGHEHLFAEETVGKVRASTRELGYRPSVAGRTLVRGTSDIVITLVPDVTFNPRVRELLDIITDGLAQTGLTNLLRFLGNDVSLEDAVLGLRPFGVVSLTPLPPAQRERLQKQGVRLIEHSAVVQRHIDEALGRLQVEHLAAAGFRSVVIAAPLAARELTFALPREDGASMEADARNLLLLPTLHVRMNDGGPLNAIDELPSGPIGVAAYNDEIAVALVTAGLHRGRDIPTDIGIIGIDNSPIAHSCTPTVTTVDYDIAFSGHEILRVLLESPTVVLPTDPEQTVESRLTIVQGQTTPVPAGIAPH